jgi:DNA ligase 1
MRLAELVGVSREVAGTRSRTAKLTLLADAMTQLADDELEIGVALLAGEPRQDRLDLGPGAVFGVDAAPAVDATLSVAAVDAALQAIADVPAGTGSRTRRIALLTDLLARATAEEQDWLRSLILRELRQGALEGLLVQALARATDLPEPALRRAAMLSGDIRVVARAAVTGGADALAAFRLELGTPLQPMLASTAADVTDAVGDRGEILVDTKLDGARVQIHRDGDEVAVFTRNLNDVTHRLPEVVALTRSLPIRRIVLDGEVLSFGRDGRPRPFQETMQRVGREQDAGPVRRALPLEVRCFDVLHADGQDVLDQPLRDRRAVLEKVVPAEHRSSSLVTDDVEAARAFLQATLAAGHEGVLVKDLAAPYEAGRRGAGWRKVKPVHTLDLVVLAAEWGSGRRRGWLSNLHLGARDDRADRADPVPATLHPHAPGYVMLGKTFKGLTDELLRWQTAALLAREVAREGHVVLVRPELVVEIALDGFVRSTRYPGGLALRFARVRRYRSDKTAAEADTLSAARAIHAGTVVPDV